MHEYVETFITNVPHIHNIASQTMGEVYFETFPSLQLTNIVMLSTFSSTMTFYFHQGELH
jgi:hypothetical protein